MECVPSQLNGPSWLVIAFSIKSCASQKRSNQVGGIGVGGEISNGTPLTKPISMRPREMTSSIEYSSATRIGRCDCRSACRAPEPHLLCLARQYRHWDRAHRVGAGRRRVVLVGHYVDPELVAQRPLVEIAVIEIGADFRVEEPARITTRYESRSSATPGGTPSR